MVEPGTQAVAYGTRVAVPEGPMAAEQRFPDRLAVPSQVVAVLPEQGHKPLAAAGV